MIPEDFMTPHEARARLRKGEKPIDLSIEKFERILRPKNWDKIEKGEVNWRKLIYKDTCGLCITYYDKACKNPCGRCPLGTCGEKSPWNRMREKLIQKEFSKAKKYAKKFLDEMKSLKKKTKS